MTDHAHDVLDAASDYVLGLMPEGESRLFEHVMERDAALARHVAGMREELLPLDLSATPRDLPEDFLDRVKIALGPQDNPPAPQTAPAFAHQKPANSPFAPRPILGLIAAALVGVAVGLGAGWLRPQPEPRVVAVLLDDRGVPQAVIEDYGNDSASVRFVADIDVPADRSLQVWTLPSPELGATSLGVLDGAAPARLRFDDLPDPNAQQLYEVTLEPAGGSPTGRPTGPVVGKGLAAPQA